MRKTLFALLPAVLALSCSLVPETALANHVAGHWGIDTSWSSTICNIVPCNGTGVGATGLANYLLTKIIKALQIGFVAAAVFYLFTAARWMVMFPEQDDMVRQGRSTFIYTIAGAAVVSIAQWVADAFAPGSTGSNIVVNTTPLNNTFDNVLFFFRMVLSILLVVNIVIQGIRLIVSQGESDQIDKARKRLIQGFIGVGLVMLANVVTVSVNPQAGQISDLAIQIAGIANYLLTILSFMCVVTIILAGVFLILSVEDSLKDKAKTIIKTAVVALVAIIVSYALVNTVIAFGT